MHLDACPLLSAQVGYGALGRGGSLGYENKQVRVRGRGYPHALSAHPPARLRFDLGGRFAGFTCQVALNDDVPPGAAHADFSVLADGREAAVELFVRAGEPPRPLAADITGAHTLELVVRTGSWEFAHAVWLDPQVDETAAIPTPLIDCLSRAEITVPSPRPHAARCIATVVSPGFERLLDDMLGSLVANGGCPDACVLVFILNSSRDCERVAAKYRATVIRGQPLTRLNLTSKSLLYSVARAADADAYLCLDADMLVLGDLNPVFSALDALPPGAILACREGNSQNSNHLGRALRLIYGGGDADLDRLGISAQEEAYPLVVNDGLFAGGRPAMLALDGAIRAMPEAAGWIDSHRTLTWRNQFIFNLALARLQCGVELDPVYNLQLQVQDVAFAEHGVRLRAYWREREVRVLHFNGGAKRKYSDRQGRYAALADPLPGSGPGDSYAALLAGLRVWIGRYGCGGLTWSFYGLADGAHAAVRDPSIFPLLAALHYLIRANGCVRVLETGTARGISTACFASAVAHRPGARVVTLDPYCYAGREDLWAVLPPHFQACIEARCVDALAGMQAALAAGEQYQAVLLDSVHTEEHVWSEFVLAVQLVCPGGLILIHDATYLYGTVAAALQRIEAAGYNVVRLWTAEDGVAEDDHLGLAVIENRLRSSASTPGASFAAASAPTVPPALASLPGDGTQP